MERHAFLHEVRQDFLLAKKFIVEIRDLRVERVDIVQRGLARSQSLAPQSCGGSPDAPYAGNVEVEVVGPLGIGIAELQRRCSRRVSWIGVDADLAPIDMLVSWNRRLGRKHVAGAWKQRVRDQVRSPLRSVSLDRQSDNFSFLGGASGFEVIP